MRTNWWDTIIWVLLFIFLVPSGLAVASWNSLPGSRLYGVKRIAENVVVAAAPSAMLKGQLQVSYTGKRLNEATQLLSDQNSAEGLEDFRKQVEAAKQAIASAPAGEARNQLAMQYVETLQNAAHQLEQQKQVISATNGASEQPQSQPQARVRPAARRNSAGQPLQQQQIVQQVIVVNQVTQVTQVVQVIQQIEQTQTQIQDTLNQVQNLGNSGAAQPTPMPTEPPTPAPTDPPTATPQPTTMQEAVQSLLEQHPNLQEQLNGNGNNNNNNNLNGEGNGNNSGSGN